MLDGPFANEEEALSSAIGRPRTATFIGGYRYAAKAEERGARVLPDEPSGGAPIDLAYVNAAKGSIDLAGTLARVASRLTDEVISLSQHDRVTDADAVVAALRAAGLDPLWRHRKRPDAPWTLSVARRPPERRKLSLTVGMISMNEAAAVGRVIDSIRAEVPEAEILLVDSSKDETPAIAESKGARVISQVPPRGYGPAMTKLLYAATTDVIVTVDCDGTYRPTGSGLYTLKTSD